MDFCEKPLLIDMQNRIVDPRFRDTDYQDNQNYVGQSISYQKQLVHYVCPKPDDLPGLMAGLLAAHKVDDGGRGPRHDPCRRHLLRIRLHASLYIDMTAQAEALYDFVKLTIEQELVEELDFLANHDKTKQAIQEIVDMPD